MRLLRRTAVLMLGALLGVAVPLAAVPAVAGTSIEATYAAGGPYSVATSTVTDSAGTAIYDIYYPSQLAGLGFRSPIITWGNGTGATPGLYTTLFDHLVSWGFTIIASTDTNTGSGRQIQAGAEYLVAQAGTPGSPFYGRLDVNGVAAVGHSQGAGGATRATLNDPALIKTLVTFSLPWNGQGPPASIWDQPSGTGWDAANPNCPTALDCWYDPSKLTRPAFFVGTHGVQDAVIANPDVERFFFEEAPAALGLILTSDLLPADHISIVNATSLGNPDGFLGYVTAWLMYRLRGDQVAAGAFTGGQPELASNLNWPGSAVK